MDSVDVVVIGGGVIGLAIAERLSRRRPVPEIVLVEKEDGFGRHTSSRNSEVIHAGFYYPSDSLKARLCVAGNPLLYEFCGREQVAYRKCGKIVIGNTVEEIEKIHRLHAQGVRNGVPGMQLITRARIAELEPLVTGAEGLMSPSTGIFDTHQFMKRLEQKAMAAGVTIVYQCEVVAIARAGGGGYVVTSREPDGSETAIGAAVVVNSAGLWSDKVAAMAGIDIDAAGYRLHPCKGEYFSVAPRHKGALSRLVYPAPTPISLGVHAVLGLNGSLKLGPNAHYVDTLDYTVSPAHIDEFHADALQYFPFIAREDLSPDMAGIRPKLQREKEAFHDFVIREESDRGLPGFVNLIGMESPGLTSALAVAAHVDRLLT